MLNIDPSIGSTYYDGDAFFPGTIWSVQPNHPDYGFSGVPTNGQVIKNVAWRNFCKITGRTAAQKADGDGTFVIINGGTNKLSVSRSSAGGVTIIPSQVNDATNTGAFFYAPAAVKQWVFDHTNIGNTVATDHVFALVVYMIPERATGGGLGNSISFAGIIRASGTSLSTLTPSAGTASYSGTTMSSSAYAKPSLFTVRTPTLRMIAGSGWNATKPADVTGFEILAGAGHDISTAFSGYQHLAGALTIWRVDLIDLTLSNLDLKLTGEKAPGAVGNYLDYETVRQTHRRNLAFMAGPSGAFYNDLPGVDPATFP